MSFDDDFAASSLPGIYDAVGTDATVLRAPAAAVPVRIIVDRNQARIGEYGQVVARVDRVRVMVSQWALREGDVLAWSDRLGAHSKAVESLDGNDGLESSGVLHG